MAPRHSSGQVLAWRTVDLPLSGGLPEQHDIEVADRIVDQLASLVHAERPGLFVLTHAQSENVFLSFNCASVKWVWSIKSGPKNSVPSY